MKASEVSIVINSETQARVSTFYARKGDAERKAKQMNAHRGDKLYKAVTYLLVEKSE